MLPIPHEFAVGGVYLPPLLVAAFIGMYMALLTRRLMERRGWVTLFYYPPLVILSLTIIYTLLVGTLFIGI